MCIARNRFLSSIITPEYLHNYKYYIFLTNRDAYLFPQFQPIDILMNKPDKPTRDRSYAQVRADDYKKLISELNRNLAIAQDALKDKTSLNLFELAAVFNNIAYTGGGIYIMESTRQGWIDQIKKQVATYGWQVVWGPTWHYPGYHWDSESDACMFIAQNPGNNNLMAIIRGTNPYSMSSWLSQDFDTGIMESIKQLVPSADAGAFVARGTYHGADILINHLKDDTTKNTAGTYLKSLSPKPPAIFVTGHSLGATLIPVYYLYLEDLLNNGGSGNPVSILPISFAGLTPGGDGFNQYFKKQLGDSYYFRFVNSLDIAPYCWWSKNGVLTIYDNNNGNGCGRVIGRPTAVIDELFYGIQGWYKEISDKIPLKGYCHEPYDLWETLALHQHHVSTYLALIAGNKDVQKTWEKYTEQQS